MADGAAGCPGRWIEVKSCGKVDAAAGPGRRGMGGPECGPRSATGREGEPIDDVSIILCCAAEAQSRSDPTSGPLVLRISGAVALESERRDQAPLRPTFVLQ